MKRNILALILAGIAVNAWAQSSPPAGGGGDGASFIKGIDKDSDGLLSKSEVAGTPLEADFEKIDSNKDGKLNAKELESFSGGGAPAAGGTPPAGSPPAAK